MWVSIYLENYIKIIILIKGNKVIVSIPLENKTLSLPWLTLGYRVFSLPTSLHMHFEGSSAVLHVISVFCPSLHEQKKYKSTAKRLLEHGCNEIQRPDMVRALCNTSMWSQVILQIEQCTAISLCYLKKW